VEIDKITQNPDLESDIRYLMELREKVAGAGDKDRKLGKAEPFGQINA
jgi:hypothetical protein